jgi:hypothetical protein
VTPEEFTLYVEACKTAIKVRHGIDAWGEAVESIRQREAERETWRVNLVRRDLVGKGDVEAARTADREARRKASGGQHVVGWHELDPARKDLAQGLKQTYLRDAEASEVLRLEEEAEAYAVYQAEIGRRGVLDFGEQILRAIQMLTERPNLLRTYQEQFRHVLVDEFQDANMAQILLLELVGRGPDKPDNVVVVGDDDQSIYRFRGASYAAFSRFSERFGQPPAWEPTRATQEIASIPLLENRRSSVNVLTAAGRLIGHNTARLKAGDPLRPTREQGPPVEVVIAADEADEADVVVTPPQAFGHCQAAPLERHRGLYRRHRDRDVIVDRAASGILLGDRRHGLFLSRVRDLEAAMRHGKNRLDQLRSALTAGPWRLDAVELLQLRLAAISTIGLWRKPPGPGPATRLGALRAKLDRLHACLDDLVPRPPGTRTRCRGLPRPHNVVRPHRCGTPRRRSAEHRSPLALRGRPRASPAARQPGRLHCVSRPVPGGGRRSRAGHATRGRSARRAAHDHLPGQGAGVRGRDRAADPPWPLPGHARRTSAAARQAAQAGASSTVRGGRGAAPRGHDPKPAARAQP